MVFHGGQPTGSKKSGMARRYKQGTSYDAYQAAVADLSVTDASNPDGEPESSDPPPVKKQRYDVNWRAVRAVRARDRKVERIQAQHKAVIVENENLQSTNVNLQLKVSNQKQAFIKITNEKYNEAKAHRMASIEKEEAHKVAVAALCEEHARKIEDAFMIADEATDKMLIAEELRLSNDRAHSKAVRAERERNHMKLEKERTDKNLVNSTVHQRWIAAMARNMTNQHSDHEKEMNKLKVRYDHFFFLFLYSVLLHSLSNILPS